MVPKISNTFQDLASRAFNKSPSKIRNIYFIGSFNRQKNTFNCVNNKMLEYIIGYYSSYIWLNWLFQGPNYPIWPVRLQTFIIGQTKAANKN